LSLPPPRFLWLAASASIHTLNIIIPVGVSYVPLDELHDRRVSREDARGLETSRCHLFHRVLPQMVAGPIVRAFAFLRNSIARNFRTSMSRCACPFLALFQEGLRGRWVKCEAVDNYFDSPAAYGAGSAWLAVLFYGIRFIATSRLPIWRSPARALLGSN
jgi:D-alanyl-lipoteichoic acid acyltransferase DltB (MBOAT superfamily)